MAKPQIPLWYVHIVYYIGQYLSEEWKPSTAPYRADPVVVFPFGDGAHH